MARRMKDAAAIADKWKSRAGAAQKDYTEGVAGAGQDWQAATAAAGDAYEQGVQAAMGRKAFQKGVSENGAARYQARAAKLGPARFTSGVAEAGGDYQRGMQPYDAALRNMQLPPRGPRRSPQNQARANAVAQRLAAIKEGK